MKIIKNGKEKKFFAKCTECATEFEYNFNDIYTCKKNELKYRVVKCPACGNEEYATLQTEKEFEFYKNFPHYPFFGCKK